MNIDKHRRKVLEHLLGPTGSLILHIIIVILLVNLIIPEETDPTPSDEGARIVDRDNTLPKFKPRPKPSNLPDEEILPELPSLPPMAKALVPEPRDLGVVAELPADMPNMVGAGPPLTVETGGGPTHYSEVIARGLRDYSEGLGKYTEPAVVKALEWLKKHQVKTGSRKGAWQPGKKSASDEQYAAITGLGLLAFLAHGETLGSEKYGDTVKMAIKYLQKSQDHNGPEGAFCRLNQQGVYAHAIATYAISEAFALTRVPELKGVMENSARLIVDGQQAGGGWDYGYAKSTRRDTSVASWQVQALKAAYMAGCRLAGIKESINKSAMDLKRAYVNDNHTFSYTDGPAQASSTSMGALCLQLIGRGKDNAVVGALRQLSDEECSWQTDEKWAMYKWYYLTQAKFHAGGRNWKKWNKNFAVEYVKNQAEDGHWEPPVKAGGHGDASFGKAFPTSLGALTLQVYYRLLPSYKSVATKKIEIERKPDKDEEIGIEVI